MFLFGKKTKGNESSYFKVNTQENSDMNFGMDLGVEIKPEIELIKEAVNVRVLLEVLIHGMLSYTLEQKSKAVEEESREQLSNTFSK